MSSLVDGNDYEQQEKINGLLPRVSAPNLQRMNVPMSLLLLIWALGSHGCAWLDQLDESRRYEQAQADDYACRKAGYHWPGDAYMECRRLAFDARQREQWQELQMSRQQQRPESGLQPLSPVAPYRPVREENFQCFEAAAAAGEKYIACREYSAED